MFLTQAILSLIKKKEYVLSFRTQDFINSNFIFVCK